MDYMLIPKKHSIHQDYYISDKILGQGSERPIVLCINRKTNTKFALKVIFILI